MMQMAMHSSYDYGLNLSLYSTPSVSPSRDPLCDATNRELPPQEFHFSRHNPNKMFRRESVIASWRSIRRERERALGNHYYYTDPKDTKDNKVKRCKSDKPLQSKPKVQPKVKRTFSVLYRYDPDSEKVIKEYKFLKAQEDDNSGSEREIVSQGSRTTSSTLKKCHSEPMIVKDDRSINKVKRSFTTLLSIKTKFLNIFSNKS